MSIVGWISRAAMLVFVLALLAYFLVREISDPVLGQWFGGAEPEVVETVPPPPTPSVSQPKREVEIVEVPVVDESAKAIQSALESELFRTREVLAESLAARLEYDIRGLQGAYEERGELMNQARQSINSVVNDIISETEAMASTAASTVASIETQLSALDAAETEITASLIVLEETWKGLAEVGEISGEALDERNYEFVEYKVGNSETLTSIARKLETEMDLPEVDLATLIPLFNDVDTRLQTLGGRKSSIRIVSNDTLRIPVPKRAGKLLADLGVEEKLESQRTMLVSAQARQTKAVTSLTSEIDNLRLIVAQVKGLQRFSEDLAKSAEALDSPDELFFLGAEATPEQREAWMDFNQQFQALQRARDPEGRLEAQEALEAATARLHETYVDAASGDAESDVEWLEGFFEETNETTPSQ